MGNDKKLTQREIDTLYIQACHASDVKRIQYAVEVLKANVNAKDKSGYAPAIVYLLAHGTETNASDIELAARYLITKGANIDFKYGDKNKVGNSKPYLLYYVAKDTNLSDNFVHYMIKKIESTKKPGEMQEYLEYTPSTKYIEPISSIKKVIEAKRPKLFQKLVKEGLINNRAL